MRKDIAARRMTTIERTRRSAVGQDGPIGQEFEPWRRLRTFLVTALTTPLPIALNSYWFYLAMKGAVRMLRPASKGGGPKEK